MRADLPGRFTSLLGALGALGAMLGDVPATASFRSVCVAGLS